MKVLITGVNGYVSQNLYSYLKNLGYEVHGLDLKTHRSATGDANLHVCNIRNEESLDT